MSISSIEQLHVFHARDRKIFTKLVLHFARSPAESLLVMATWFWLEDFGFGDTLSSLMAFNDPIIADLADEAVSCFRCLESPEPPQTLDWIPLTTRFMANPISLQIIYKNRYSAITGIKNFLSTVCSKIFSDILQLVLPPSSRISLPMNIPGFPHPTFGGIFVRPHVMAMDSITPRGLWGWNANCIATENDRTVFLTFSRGFEVSVSEVKYCFTRRFGDGCVEGVFMQEKNEDVKQSLYARLVLDSVATVDKILRGSPKPVKFIVNKKHIWARKYGDKPKKET
ncbi:unnamed protein product [Microthlaspi erraticum]|uniref:Uncharacterized protein n=1 Tax=Microthlaspi erraticum TaxID=1685480 RepID=A0A6D2HRW3_9BRAS|nr:unnamed protein product [Microthlaspi erraticum]